ncbi:class I SAM-dependent methyltransferase [Paenibacillus sp. 2TAB26]|uniref:class I SAM-dependent methyltransferase n=1 Tax=Paenibacillus sp. 2TAB26 TaxID=3233005 RepID=UPI003F9C4242
MDDEITKMERMYATSFHDVMMDHHYRYHFALNYIRRGDYILDAACGSGYGTHYLATNSACTLTIGVDRSDHALNWAIDHFYCDNTVYVKSDLSGLFQEELPIQKFDVITCFETVEHMKDDRSFVQKLYDSLNVNGILLISAPNEKVIPHLNNPYFLGGVNPHHYRHYQPNELSSLLTDCGFRIQQVCTQDNETYELIIGRDDGFTTVLVAMK